MSFSRQASYFLTGPKINPHKTFFTIPRNACVWSQGDKEEFNAQECSVKCDPRLFRDGYREGHQYLDSNNQFANVMQDSCLRTCGTMGGQKFLIFVDEDPTSEYCAPHVSPKMPAP